MTAHFRVRSTDSPFDVHDRRAMVSLGSPSSQASCSYSCSFCYVQAGFPAYPRLSIPVIVKWLASQPSDCFDIIYVSGDTDSFAQGRTSQGLSLLEELRALGKDVLFTTKMVLSEADLRRLGRITESYHQGGLDLFGCVSVAQATRPDLEPPPIRPSLERIRQLHRFREMGIVSVLAARPFLPVIPLSDYEWILEQSRGGVDLVLGEGWWVDQDGVLEDRVLGSGVRLTEFELKRMPFDDNDNVWKVYEPAETKDFFENWCQSAGVPFFMRSRQGIDWFRARK